MSKFRFLLLGLAPLAALALLTSCGSVGGWDHDYRLRFWQKYKLDGETDYVRGRYASARDLWQEAVRQAEAVGHDDFRVGISLYDVALAQEMLQQHAQAAESLEHAKAVFEHCLEQQSSAAQRQSITHELANTLALLGQTYAILGQNPAADGALVRACETYDSLSNLYDGDPVLRRQHAEAVASLAILDLDMDRRKEAEAHFQQALPLAEESFSSPTEMENLKRGYASLMKITARDDEAQQLFPDDPQLSRLLTEAEEAASANDWAKQKQAADAALKIARSSASPQITEARTLSELILPAASRGHYALAEEYANRAFQLRKQARAEHDDLHDHLQTVTARAYIQSEQFAKALPLLLDQLAWRKQNMNDGKLRLSETNASIADCYARTGQPALAQPYIAAVQNVLSHKVPAKNRRQVVLVRIADALIAQGKDSEALPILQEVLNSPTRRKGDKRFRMAERYLLLADCEKGSGMYDAADKDYRQAFQILEPINQTVAGACAVRWAESLTLQSDSSGALNLYSKALSFFDAVGHSDPAVQIQLTRALPAYARLLRESNKIEAASKLEERFATLNPKQ